MVFLFNRLKTMKKIKSMQVTGETIRARYKFIRQIKQCYSLVWRRGGFLATLWTGTASPVDSGWCKRQDLVVTSFSIN